MLIQYNKPSLTLNKSDYENITNIIKSGWVSIGKNVNKLEDYFKHEYNVKYAIACSCATQGLVIAIKAAGWRNKRIAVPSFTWPSTIYAIESNNGNEPIFKDIDLDTWLIDLGNSDDYDCILAVDIFGNQANITTTKPIIYDAAHGFGNNKLGRRGLAEVVSFSFTKRVTAMEGGMILTDNKDLFECAYELRRLTARMEEINAYIALKSIEDYKYNTSKINSLVCRYKDKLKLNYKTQKCHVTNHSVFAIEVDTHIKNLIMEALRDNGIEFKSYYEPLVGNLKNTDYIYSRIIALPLYPSLKMKEVDIVCNVINKAVKNVSPGAAYLRSNYLRRFIQNENNPHTA